VDCYDTLAAHLAAADGEVDRAVAPLGLLMAWCVNLHLISARVASEHETLVLRIRFQEATGSELVVACGGTLRRDMFNADGQRFLDSYYPRFMQDVERVFERSPYAVEDDWRNYPSLAAVLTRAKMGSADRTGGGVLSRAINGWHRLWR